MENLLTGQIVSTLFVRIISLIVTYDLIVLLFAVLLTIQHQVYVMSIRYVKLSVLEFAQSFL